LQALKSTWISFVALLIIGTQVQGQTPQAGDVAAQAPTAAAEPEEDRPGLRAATVPQIELQLDGVLAEPAWATAESITTMRTIEPEEGGEPVGKTIVKVLVSPKEIVIGLICNDPDPSGIISFSKARDAELDDEDHVLVVLDTFLDGRSGYVFAVNPSGTRFDGLVSAQGTDVNSNWDAVWEARTVQNGTGWSTEIRIPIKSLGYKPGLTSWGLNIERRVQRLQETSRWSAVSQDYEIFQTSRAGLLTNLPNFDAGLGLSIRPAISGRSEKVSADVSTELSGDPSVDVTQKLGANLLGSLTVNTDFAETEVDARQTNLTRFEIFFPEKRTFFLEGADIFEFGLGLEETLIPFFSRRIGLGEDGVQIPINAGGKINGRVGNTNLGGLVVNTRHVDSLDAGEATMAAMRIKQNVFDESSIGMIATYGDQMGAQNSWMGGADFTYNTSRFRGDKNLSVSAWGLLNDKHDLDGDKSAYGLGFDYPNDRWNFNMASARIGDGFDPSLGFVPRTGVYVSNGAFAFEPRPGRAQIRQMYHRASVFLVNDLEREWQSYTMDVKPFDWLFESGDRIGFRYNWEGDRPDEEFDVFEGQHESVVIPAGSYEWQRYIIEGSLAEKRPVSAEVLWASGTFYDGNLDTIEANLAFKQSLFRLEFGVERNTGTLPDGDFTQYLYSGRLELKFTPDLQFSSFAQYDNESESVGTNTRLRWTFTPSGDLFVVYNHNLQRSLNDRLRQVWDFESNALIVKLQYAWRP
jgi:Domain of unknown function (DUF5916)